MNVDFIQQVESLRNAWWSRIRLSTWPGWFCVFLYLEVKDLPLFSFLWPVLHTLLLAEHRFLWLEPSPSWLKKLVSSHYTGPLLIPGFQELEFKHNGITPVATETSVINLKHPHKKLSLSSMWSHRGNVVPSHLWTILLLTMVYKASSLIYQYNLQQSTFSSVCSELHTQCTLLSSELCWGNLAKTA